MTDMPPVDPVVRRANELTTTALDALAMLAICGGLVVVLEPVYGWGAGLVAGGVLLAALSLLTQVLHRDRPQRKARAARKTVPGPEDPGTLHMMGH